MAERQRRRNKTKACTQQRVNDIKWREDLRKIAKLKRKYSSELARGVFLRSKMSLLVASTSNSVTTLEFRWEIF